MDQPGADRTELLSQLRQELGEGFFDFAHPDLEQLALCDETLLDEFLETGTLADSSILRAVTG